jgi:transcriptional regulator with AAA-type ATPase domain
VRDLQASWLGSWKAPWGLDRGRRWGDPAWALAALAQAWLTGGQDGRWPKATWTAKRPVGPQLTALPEVFEPLPAPEWISLLRHGSHKIPATQRGRGETDLVHHCWLSLLNGDGSPWMALGSVLFDRKIRTRWIPVLAAVDETGLLHLPPFSEALIPPWLRQLPEGWWRFLLSRTDPSGMLLPEGPPPEDFPWKLLEPSARDCLEPLLLPTPPRVLTSAQLERWALQLTENAWMLDPRLRAWGRGRGIDLESLMPLVPPSLALGDAPTGSSANVLADPSMAAPPVPVKTYGYPPAVVPAHPCADPFHWLEQGLRANPVEALSAFRWACAHFKRLNSPGWIRRVASAASTAALAWGDLPTAEAWRTLRGREGSPAHELEEAEFLAAYGNWDQAATALRKLAQSHPDLARAWVLLAQSAVILDRPDFLQEALPHLEQSGLREVLKAAQSGHALASVDTPDPESRLLWGFHRAIHGSNVSPEFWLAWENCPQQPLRMEAGLRLLERCPDQRTPARLLDLQGLVDRSESVFQKSRLASLWPSAIAVSEPAPHRMLENWLHQRKQATWLVWGASARPNVLGTGIPPPPSALASLHEKGRIEPLRCGEDTWWGHPLHWEGCPVGSVLMTVDPEAPFSIQPDTQFIAPWLARLMTSPAPLEPVLAKHLLTDGSEPMASVLAELVRVAPSELPVLILGPTGSGKELTAHEIHERSGRKGPFRPINCSEYAETLLESELFGHMKGSFTGADRDRKGAIECAEGGTLFLDEVADLTPRLQSLFLRVLQEKEIRRVGSERVHRVDVRFLAATHRSLEQMVASGAFRRDLYYRLKGVVITLPSLRERRHEFPYLIPRLTLRLVKEGGLQPPGLAPGLPLALARHPWPGNFRELCHAIESALLRCTDGVLKAVHFPELDAPPGHEQGWNEATQGFQRNLLIHTLKQHRFQITEAAQCLGITRPALYTAARRLGLDLLAERKLWNTVGR